MKKKKCSVCKKKRPGSKICTLKNGQFICNNCCDKIRGDDCKDCDFIHEEKSREKDRSSAHENGANGDLSVAMEHHMAGNLSEADKVYRKILKKSPENTEALRMAGVLALQKGEFLRAVNLLEKALKLDPAQTDLITNLGAAYNGLGTTLISEGKTGEAADAFKQAISINPKHLEAYNNLGCLQKNTGQLDEAVASFQKAIAADPRSAVIHNNLGNALFVKGDAEQAIQAYEKAIQADPKYARAHYNMAATFTALKYQEKAAVHYQQAIAIDPNFFEARINLGALYRQIDEPEDAIEMYKKSLLIKPDSAQAHCNLGICYHSQKKYEDAIHSFKEAIRINPDYDEAQYCLGLSFHMEGKIDDAVLCYERALKINPEHHKALYALGKGFVGEGRLDEAIECFNKVIQIHGRFSDVYNQLADVYRNIGRTGDAITYFKKSLDADSGDIAAGYMLAALEGNTPESAPPELVKNLFDDYADRFDQHLTQKLEYKTPSILRYAVGKIAEKETMFENILDIGCGTGLAGVEFRDMGKRLEGVDISPNMVEKAREKKIYDHLIAGDFSKIHKDGRMKYDLIIAADVFVYIGALSSIFQLTDSICTPGGLFAFSTERHEGEGFQLRENGRYAHAKSYVEMLARENKFTIEFYRQVPLRKEREQWVEGDIYVLKRRA